MLAATIVPTPYLHLTKDDVYLMALAHLIGVDKEYTDFFIERGKEGKFILMDNGVVENDQRPLEELVEKALLINASEIILPDTLYDSGATLRDSKAAIDRLRRMHVGKAPFGLMAVPQGQDFHEWYRCAAIMLQWDIDAIGISKFTTPKFVEFRGKARRFCFGALAALGCKKDIHFLGCWDDPAEMADLTTLESLATPTAKMIRGTDSAIAYAYAREGKLLSTHNSRPMEEIDFAASTALEAILDTNITRWRDYCAGKLYELPEQGVSKDTCK